MYVKDMLAKARSAEPITTIEAREAMLGCFVTIHGETLKRGATLLGKALSDEEAENMARTNMKTMMGDAWDKPTAKALEEVKVRLDQKMNFSKAPEDLRELHDQVCTLIVSKAK
jgi:hypothetical protein